MTSDPLETQNEVECRLPFYTLATFLFFICLRTGTGVPFPFMVGCLVPFPELGCLVPFPVLGALVPSLDFGVEGAFVFGVEGLGTSGFGAGAGSVAGALGPGPGAGFAGSFGPGSAPGFPPCLASHAALQTASQRRICPLTPPKRKNNTMNKLILSNI